MNALGVLTVLTLVGLLPIPKPPATSDRGEYFITPLVNNPGLYYEQLEDIRLIRIKWRIATYVDVKALLRRKPAILAHLDDMVNHCNKRLDFECDFRPAADSLRHELRYLELPEAQLVNLVDPTERFRIDPNSGHKDRNFYRQEAPFAPVGEISWTLFGTLTQQDAQIFSQEIDRLHASQLSVSNLLEKQAVITQSEMHDVHAELDRLRDATSAERNRTEILLGMVLRQQREEDLRAHKNAGLSWIQQIRA